MGGGLLTGIGGVLVDRVAVVELEEANQKHTKKEEWKEIQLYPLRHRITTIYCIHPCICD